MNVKDGHQGLRAPIWGSGFEAEKPINATNAINAVTKLINARPASPHGGSMHHPSYSWSNVKWTPRFHYIDILLPNKI